MDKTSIRVESINNFATAAGMASSASGLACLARCMAAVYGLEEAFKGEFSIFARLGSGSACRSIYGGVVEWDKGFSAINEIESQPEAVSRKAIAKKVELRTLDFWLENLSVLICVVKPEAGKSAFKDIPSTEGMKLSLQTSEMLRLRLENDLPTKHIVQLKEAMEAKDFHTFS